MTFPETLDDKTFRLFVQRTVHLMNSNAVLSRAERQLATIIEEHPEIGLYFLNGVTDISEPYPDDEFNPFIMLSALWEVERQVEKDTPKGIRKLADRMASNLADADLKIRLAHLYIDCFYRWHDGEAITEELYLSEAEKILSDPLYYEKLFAEIEGEESEEGEYNSFYSSAIDRAFSLFEKKMFDDASTVGISPTSRMAACMNKLPSEWINAVAIYWQRPAQKLKRDRIKDLVSFLLDPNHIEQVLLNLDDEEKSLLHYLLDNDGFAKYGQLVKRFGGEDKTYWWTENPPQTVIGRLRSKGLLYTGVTPIKSRNYKIGMIPKDLLNLIEGKL